MKTFRLLGIGLAVSLFVGLGSARANIVGINGFQDPIFVFDEDGHGTYDLEDGTGTHPWIGVLAPDPSNGGLLALTFTMPTGATPVGNGDVLVLDPDGIASDGLRWTDAAGNLTGGTADRMMFYSTDSLGQLADTGLPANFLSGATGGPVTERADGTFTYGAGSFVYNGVSAVTIPEPSTFAIAGLGALGMVVFGRRRRARA